MGKIFRSNIRKPLRTFPLMNKVVALIKTRQQQLADWLQEKTKSWTRQKWLVILVIFCAVSLFVAAKVMLRATADPTVFAPQIENIHSPKQYHLIDRGPSSKLTVDELKHYMHYLDSLDKNDAERFDAIVKGNARLVDSLRSLINLYEAQIK